MLVTVKGAKRAAGLTEIGVVDISIHDKRHRFFRVTLLPDAVCPTSQFQQVAMQK
jgi:hypothetical protein